MADLSARCDGGSGGAGGVLRYYNSWVEHVSVADLKRLVRVGGAGGAGHYVSSGPLSRVNSTVHAAANVTPPIDGEPKAALKPTHQQGGSGHAANVTHQSPAAAARYRVAVLRPSASAALDRPGSESDISSTLTASRRLIVHQARHALDHETYLGGGAAGGDDNASSHSGCRTPVTPASPRGQQFGVPLTSAVRPSGGAVSPESLRVHVPPVVKLVFIQMELAPFTLSQWLGAVRSGKYLHVLDLANSSTNPSAAPTASTASAADRSRLSAQSVGVRIRRRLALQAVSLAQSLVAALDAIHRCGYVHRDVKPENIFLLPRANDKTTAVTAAVGAGGGGSESPARRGRRGGGRPSVVDDSSSGSDSSSTEDEDSDDEEKTFQHHWHMMCKHRGKEEHCDPTKIGDVNNSNVTVASSHISRSASLRDMTTGCSPLMMADTAVSDLAAFTCKTSFVVKMGDFGLARRTGESADEPAGFAMPQTEQYTIGVGSPYYASPEQLAGKDCAPPADWYSVGVVLAEALLLPPGCSFHQRSECLKALKAAADTNKGSVQYADVCLRARQFAQRGLLPEAMDVVIKLLSTDPSARPSVRRLTKSLTELRLRAAASIPRRQETEAPS
jgi:serine/threonine protein kinase